MATDHNTPKDNLLRWIEVSKRVPISRSYAHALAAKDLFPKPIKLIPGGRASAWKESEINAWVAERISEAQPISQDLATGGVL